MTNILPYSTTVLTTSIKSDIVQAQGHGAYRVGQLWGSFGAALGQLWGLYLSKFQAYSQLYC
jgi:hypothetical protein